MSYVQKIFVTVGLTWTAAQRSELEKLDNFNHDDCKLPVEFIFDKDAKDTFPRKMGSSSYADFAIYNMPNNEFQTKTLSMSFETVNFNWYAQPHSKNVRT